MAICETVKIKDDSDGFIVINEIDFDAETHSLFEEKAPEDQEAPADTPAPKKTAPKKTAPKKTAPKKTAPKKTAPKKTAPKKTK